MGEGRIFRNMFQEQLPLNLKAVVERLIVRNIKPVLAKVEGIFDVGVPDWTWSMNAMLRPAFSQAGDGASKRTVHLQAEEFVPVDTKRPGGVDLSDDATIKLECPI